MFSRVRERTRLLRQAVSGTPHKRSFGSLVNMPSLSASSPWHTSKTTLVVCLVMVVGGGPSPPAPCSCSWLVWSLGLMPWRWRFPVEWVSALPGFLTSLSVSLSHVTASPMLSSWNTSHNLWFAASPSSMMKASRVFPAPPPAPWFSLFFFCGHFLFQCPYRWQMKQRDLCFSRSIFPLIEPVSFRVGVARESRLEALGRRKITSCLFLLLNLFFWCRCRTHRRRGFLLRRHPSLESL